MRNSDIMEMVDDLLDSEGDVVIGSLTFSRSDIVKRLDPIAYREICNDVVSSQIDDLQYDLDRLDPELDADEIADIKERIEDLEGAF
jgi:sugar-specific transcriptional regulator TrmB